MERKYNKSAMKREAISSSVLLFCLIVFPAVLPCLVDAEGDAFEQARARMVQADLKGRDITDAKVLSAMGKVPRHLFIDKNLRDAAYNDYPLPIGEGQTISQPYIVALMTQSLNLKPTDRVLEVGTGSGYQAAVLAELVDQVYSIEIDKKLAEKAAKTLQELGYKKVQVKQGDGFFGWPEHAPFDAIMVTCAAERIPEPLITQLKDGGRLIIPVGSTAFYQHLTLITRVKGENQVKQIIPVRFVPMTGEAEK
jgi:protein-L-isoaspartate(D-aspartate) O-methyltransferase